VRDIITYGRVAPETQAKINELQMASTVSKNQMERLKEINQIINKKATEDPYYNPDAAIERVRLATHGEGNDVDFRTRGDRLAQAENALDGPESFRFDKYRADYVKQLGKS